MDTIIVKELNGKKFNKSREEVIECGLCDGLTTMLGTKRCDRCWELEYRVKSDIKLAKKIIKGVETIEATKKRRYRLEKELERKKIR